MLKRKYRLQKQKDINAVHKQGKSFFTKHLIIKVLPNELEYSRFTVVVSTKVNKSAVKRNRLRRVIFGYLEKASITPGYDCIIIASKNCFEDDKKTLKRNDVISSLEFALKKVGLLQS